MDKLIARLIRRFIFGSISQDADGWYIWRNSPTWPKYEYRIVEVANGMMIDSEPADSFGAEWRVVACKPYGQFKGPILSR